MKFETRPAWKTPIMCENMKDKSDTLMGIKLSMGINIPIEDSGLKFKLMDAMSDAIESILHEERLINPPIG